MQEEPKKYGELDQTGSIPAGSIPFIFYNSHWLRDVKPNEVVCLRITDLARKPSKRPFVAAFTDEDPMEMPTRPKTSWHLCNGKMSLATAECRVDSLILLMYDIDQRLAFIGVDGQLRVSCFLKV